MLNKLGNFEYFLMPTVLLYLFFLAVFLKHAAVWKGFRFVWRWSINFSKFP